MWVPRLSGVVVGEWATAVSLWLGEVGSFGICSESGVADGTINGLISEL